MTKKLENHPILQQIRPSSEQIEPIISRGQDLVVTAGAGTGKTRTLVARYLSLLVEEVPLRSIVAITFTKKAAREMRNRIREEVRRYLQRGDLIQDDHLYWREIYEELDAARISTIHSLAADILREYPAEMNLDPRFDLIEEGDSARLKAQSIEFALSRAADDPNSAPLFVTIGEWSLRRILGDLLSKRLDIEALLDQQNPDIWEIWEPILIQPLRDFVEHPLVHSGLEGLASLEEQGMLKKAEDAGDSLVPDLRIVIEVWKEIKRAHQDGNWIEISRWLGPLRSHLKQKGRKDNWAPAKPKALIKEIQGVFDSLLESKNLDLSLDRKFAQVVLPALYDVFQQANNWYSGAKEKLGVLDYDDLESKSLSLLKNFPVVLASWQNQVRAILVDEFQDTNGRQRELVSLLNGDDHKLFIVGDGKQSIYRFRGADVAVFREEQKKISKSGKEYQLATSYRAHPDLIGNLNQLLQPVLGDESSLPYVEPFSPLLPGRKDAPSGLKPPYIELHLAAGSKAAGAMDIAASAAAHRLRELVESKVIRLKVSGDGKRRPLSYGDMAVLCRASSSFPAYETAFEKAGIPYLTIAGQGFYDRPEIRDVLNALLALAEPQNDLAVAGLLRSPAGGLSDAAIMSLRDFQQELHLPSLLQATRQAQEVGLGDETGQALWIASLIDELRTFVGRVSVGEILWMLIERTSYLAALTSIGLTRSVQNLKKLLADAQNSGEVNISGFINTISELRNVSVREGEAQSVAEGAVQIMTVHQSKGLEFPVVVLGDASKRSRYGRGILLDQRFGLITPFSEDQIIEDKNGILKLIRSSSLAYDLSLTEERLREEAESDRLLYVAATRAQDLLIINGNIGIPSKDQNLRVQPGWLGKLASQLGLTDMPLSFQVKGSNIHEFTLDNPGLTVNCTIYELGVDFDSPVTQKYPAAKSNGEDYYPMLERILVKGSITSWDAEQDQPIRRVVPKTDRPTAPAWVVGELVHRALERWYFPDNGESAFTSWLETGLRGLGLSDEKQIYDGCKRTVQNLNRFQASELYQRMVEADKLYHELPFSFLNEDEEPIVGVIDALFFEGENWILVEFKTDRISNQEAFRKLWKEKDYQNQVAGYLTAVEKLIGVRPLPVLCFLNYEKRIHLVTDRW